MKLYVQGYNLGKKEVVKREKILEVIKRVGEGGNAKREEVGNRAKISGVPNL